MSEPMVDNNGQSADESLRHIDEEMVQLRLETIRETVLPAVIGSPRFEGFSDWQQEVVTGLAANLAADQTVDLPTRSGKSYLIRQLAQACQEQGLRALIVAPRQHILHEHAASLEAVDIPVAKLGLTNVRRPDEQTTVEYISTQTIARSRHIGSDISDSVDVVLIDEGHLALGKATVEGARALFPDAVRIAFTASPDYSATRSVTDEYGEKLISRSIVEAIHEGKVPPVRAFLYKTHAQIDNLDPTHAEFTPRELRRLAHLNARNDAIVDMAQDLVSRGRQGLVTTIPGEDLLHAEILAEKMSRRNVKTADGTERPMRVRVVRGSDEDQQTVMADYEAGHYDILLYCDLLRVGYTTKVASFLLNGRPTTSNVNLTQDIGRVLDPKEGEMILVDFYDESKKRQCTIYDVLELNLVSQGVSVGPVRGNNSGNSEGSRNSYMRNLFRPDLVARFEAHDNQLVNELHYTPGQRNPYKERQAKYEEDQAKEFAKQQRIWEAKLKRDGLSPIGDDYFSAKSGWLEPRLVDGEPDGTYDIRFKPASTLDKEPAVDIVEHRQGILPVVPITPSNLDKLHPLPRVGREENAVENAIKKEQIAEAISAALDDMNDRDAFVIRMRFGLGEYATAHTLEQVDDELNLTKERIRIIEARAFSELRTRRYVDSLYSLLDARRNTTPDPSREAMERFREASALSLTVSGLRRRKAEQAAAAAASNSLEGADNERTANQKLMKARDIYFSRLRSEVGESPADYYDTPREKAANAVIKLTAGMFRIRPYDYKGLNAILDEVLSDPDWWKQDPFATSTRAARANNGRRDLNYMRNQQIAPSIRGDAVKLYERIKAAREQNMQ